MPNCSEKITNYFYGLQISAKCMPDCSEKNYKLFLWIADLREIYAKLFTNVRDRNTKTKMQTDTMDRKLKEQTPIISDGHKITCWGRPKQPNAS